MLAKGPGVNMSIDIKGTGGDQSNNATQRDIFSKFLLFFYIPNNNDLIFYGFSK